MRQVILTRQFSRHFRHRAPNGYLQWCNIKCCHVILTTTLIIIINDVLTHIIIWSWVLDVCFTPTVVYHKYQNQDCKKEKDKVMNNTAINLPEKRSEWVSEIWGSHYSDNKDCCVLSTTWYCVAWYMCMDISNDCAATCIRVHNNDGEGSRILSNVGVLPPDHMEPHSRRWQLSSWWPVSSCFI